MTDRVHSGGEEEATRYEIVMSDGVGREMGEVPEPDRMERLRVGAGEDLLADLPVVRVSPYRGVLLRKGDICGDRPVQEGEAVSLKDRSDGRREKLQRGEDRFSDRDVGPRSPGEGILRSEKKPEERGEERGG
jgi:hypothetical protein